MVPVVLAWLARDARSLLTQRVGCQPDSLEYRYLQRPLLLWIPIYHQCAHPPTRVSITPASFPVSASCLRQFVCYQLRRTPARAVTCGDGYRVVRGVTGGIKLSRDKWLLAGKAGAEKLHTWMWEESIHFVSEAAVVRKKKKKLGSCTPVKQIFVYTPLSLHQL